MMEVDKALLNILQKKEIQILINNHNFTEVYKYLLAAFGDSAEVIGEFTELLLKVEVDPLNYMGYVPAAYLFYSSNISDYEIPNHIKYIGKKAFYEANISNTVIPDSVQKIEHGAFVSTYLERVEIPGSVKVIESFAFSDCKKLTRVFINEGVEEILHGVFAACENLEYVQLPQSIKIMQESIFDKCNKLKQINYNGTVKKWNALTWKWFTDNSYDRLFPRDLKVMCVDGETNAN